MSYTKRHSEFELHQLELDEQPMTINSQVLFAISVLCTLALVGGLYVSAAVARNVGTASQVKSIIEEAIGYEHRSTVTITLSTTGDNSTLTITDAAGNTDTHTLSGTITINGQSTLTATMQPDGTTSIPGVTATSVPVVTPNANLTLSLSPLGIQ